MEFGIVALFTLVSMPQGCRGSALALVVAACGVAQAIGASGAIKLRQAAGFVGNGLVAGSLTLLGVLAIMIWLRDDREHVDAAEENDPR